MSTWTDRVSAKGMRWVVREAEPLKGEFASETVRRLLAMRGLTEEDAPKFLRPMVKDLMPDPLVFADMEAAIDRLAHSILKGHKVAVFGDYDVDGATSSALWMRYLRSVGIDCDYHIPDRMTEGYGPNAPALLRQKEWGADVSIVVDSGTTAFDPLSEVHEKGHDVVVIDHHSAEQELPPCRALVNPNRLDCQSKLGYMCAAGVSFMTIVGLNRALRKAGHFAQRQEPSMMKLLDLVALGTVADVVPLIGLNRALVRSGLKVMNEKGNAGIVALGEVGRVNGKDFAAYHCGYILGPRVNAGGRVGDSMMGTRLLMTDDRDEAVSLAHQLDQFNHQRKDLENQAVDTALEEFASGDIPGAILAYHPDWHEGVVGIVASRLKDRYETPTMVATSTPEGLVKGSARSVPGFDIGAAIIEARQKGILVKGGGHPMAGGFTLKPEKLEEFRSFMLEKAKDIDREALETCHAEGVFEDVPEVDVVREIEDLAPFGTANEQPFFIFPNMEVCEVKPISEGRNMILTVQAPSRKRMKVLAFGISGTDLFAELAQSVGRKVDIVGTLEIDDYFKDRPKVSCFLKDAYPH